MATVPSAPGVFRILSYTNRVVSGDVNGGDNGGSATLQHQLGYGTSPNVPGNGGGFENLSLSTGSGTVEDMQPGTRYYFWSRRRNALGFGPWSARNEVTTRDVPSPTDYPVLISKTQTSITVKINANYDGDSPLTKYRLGWGTGPGNPQFFREQGGNNSSNVFLVEDLIPGALYYFWGQARNVYGLSDYSVRAANTLIAGAKVKVGAEWKRAVPYVKVDGVWRVARPWGKIAGFWNETPE